MRPGEFGNTREAKGAFFMRIRPAVPADLPEFARVYAAAKAYMRANGNPHQWSAIYPDPETLTEDIAAGQLYAVEAAGGVHGVFALIPGADPSYAQIDGAWPNALPYATIHRIASDGRVPGVFAACADFAKARYLAVRMDTHADNQPMQRLAEKHGFVYCGVVQLEGVGPRLAYQWTRPQA